MGTNALFVIDFFCHAGRVYAVIYAKVRTDIRIRVRIVVIRIRKTEPGRQLDSFWQRTTFFTYFRIKKNSLYSSWNVLAIYSALSEVSVQRREPTSVCAYVK